MAKSKTNKYIALGLILMAATWAWAFYRLIVEGIGGLLEKYAGIVEPNIQNLIIVVVFGLILLKWGGKTIEDLLRKR